MRNLFPENCFDTKEYGQTKIRQLKSASMDDSNGEITIFDDDAFVLTQWLEKGVFEAVNKEYIRAMVFTIFTKNPKTGADIILENYEFKLIEEDDTTDITTTTAAAATENENKVNSTSIACDKKKLATKDQLKAQASKFVRG